MPFDNKFPDVTVIVLTYKRAELVQQCIATLRERLQYPADKLRYMVADDCSGVADELKRKRDMKGVRFVSTDVNSGMAASYNHAIASLETDLYFFIESDYMLMRELDLRAGVALMETRKNIGMLRYRGSAGTYMVFHQFETDTSDYYPEYQDGVGLPGKMTYLQFDSGSPDLWIWSNGAHLARKSNMLFYLPYPTGGKLGEMEERFAHIFKQRMKDTGAPAVAIFPTWISMFFDHIAPTYQLTELDKGWK